MREVTLPGHSIGEVTRQGHSMGETTPRRHWMLTVRKAA